MVDLANTVSVLLLLSGLVIVYLGFRDVLQGRRSGEDGLGAISRQISGYGLILLANLVLAGAVVMGSNSKGMGDK